MGVYQIRHAAFGGLAYIGSSIRMECRWHGHRSSLRCGRHHCHPLQAAWDTHGESAFRFEILEAVNDERMLAERERYWMSALRKDNGVFNKVRSGRHTLVEVA